MQPEARTFKLGMAMGHVRVGWTENPTHKKIESGEKLHSHPRVKFQTRACTHWVLGARQVC
jgi:hypothetical protein